MTNHQKWRRAVFSMLAVHACLLAYSGWIHSPTYDEVAYLPAGVSHWHFGRFDLAKVTPPLVRLWSAAPVVLWGAHVDWKNYSVAPNDRAEHRVGRDFVAVNGGRVFWLFTLARWACIPFSLLGAWICWNWATELYGPASGFLASSLWCFSPTVLAHAPLVTADAAAAALGVLAAYWFWRWTRRPDWPGAVTAGWTLGAAMLAKTTWVVLFGLWPLLALVAIRSGRRDGIGVAVSRAMATSATQMAAMLGLAILIINLAYTFEGSFQRLEDFQFTSRTLSGLPSGDRDAETGNRFANRAVGRLPVPLPASYVYGIDLQKWDFERRMWSYLRGQWKHGGWWYYYMYAAAVKVPLGTWMLVLLCLVARIAKGEYSADWRDELLLLGPSAVVFTLVSSQTGFNHHFRYVLPALPFVLIWISSLGRSLVQRHRCLALATGAALTWCIVSSLAAFPHSLAYFNLLAGGPTGGRFHLAHSNLDWGQDLLLLKRWVEEHPSHQPLYIEYFPSHAVSPKIADIDYRAVSVNEVAVPSSSSDANDDVSWLAISVRELQRRNSRFGHLLSVEPQATVGYSIYVYRVHIRGR